jgi:hypothetical protein
MDVTRLITAYEKAGDKLIKDVDINNISLNILIQIIAVDEDDENVYKVYKLTKSQFQKLSQLVPELHEMDFNKLDVFYECYRL